MQTYRLPQSVCNVIPLDEVGMTSDTPQVEVPAKPLCWVTDDETDRIVASRTAQLGVTMLSNLAHSSQTTTPVLNNL